MQRAELLMHNNLIVDELLLKETLVLPCCLGNFQLV